MALEAAARFQRRGLLSLSSVKFLSRRRLLWELPAAARISGGLAILFSAQLSVNAPRDCSEGNGEDGYRGCFDDAVALLARAPVLPKMVVVDLDYTMWPLYCQYRTLLSAPTAYPQSVDIIRALAASRVALAVASRTPSIAVALNFLEKLSIMEYFSYLEIYFTLYSKTKHFTALREKSGIPYSSMLFFDDEQKNIDSASKMGVHGVQVVEGLDLKSLEKGLRLMAAKS